LASKDERKARRRGARGHGAEGSARTAMAPGTCRSRAYPPGTGERSRPMAEPDTELARKIDLVWSQREIERMIYAVGYAIEDGDFQRVGDVMGDATFGADLIGRKAFRGGDEIRDQYARTNIVYPDRGRGSKEIYHNVLVDIDLDRGTATSVTSYT